MDENTGNRKDDGGAPTYLAQRLLCIDHARDLVASAELLLANDEAYPNIAYHLAALALEEIGKAGMLCSRGIMSTVQETSWIDKRLDDHVWKLMWAVWSPALEGKMDPESFNEAREFAEVTHGRRMAGLYVSYEHGAAVAPRQIVTLDEATLLLNLAKSRLNLEEASDAPTLENTKELEWYLAVVSDDLGKKRLFSQPFLKKYEELGGNTRTWIQWAREEFRRVAETEKDHIKRELARQASQPGHGKPKWLMKVRVQTPSHSLRQKTLNFWNDRIEAVKLRSAGAKDQELLLEIIIRDHIKLDQLFDYGLAFTKMHLVALNIGTGGFFWYELSSQAQAYYESIRDLEAPDMDVVLGRVSGLSKEWEEDLPHGRKRKRIALEESHLNNAIRALAVFQFMLKEHEAESIFSQYILGLSLLSKTDLHLSLDAHARDAFLIALRRAMHHFGDLESVDAPVLPTLHRVFESVIKEEEHRIQMFGQLENPDNASLSDAVAAKRAADLYLAVVARRLWPEFIKLAKGRGDSQQSGAQSTC